MEFSSSIHATNDNTGNEKTDTNQVVEHLEHTDPKTVTEPASNVVTPVKTK